MNNYEKIRQMSQQQMAMFLTQIHCRECSYPRDWARDWENCEQTGCWCHPSNNYQDYMKWLSQEEL